MQNYRPFTGITPAVKILLILNLVMYFLSMFIDSRMGNAAFSDFLFCLRYRGGLAE